ncbi:EexN family lipoprotein [Bartonella melophagi]|uniref:Lipoprotein n=1 Tax=Bartonella melophagi K-2C TaxID=1094557 RepID=J0ZIQ0_9HYPH|nr:EexN family lipoprotein [Bartonella melophagi]EJF88098.1 hypothetical protein ME3_01253 [Bartonella melophagi K-2C]
MNKIIMTTLLFCTGLIIAGCEKTYSVEEFKQNKELLNEWAILCGSLDQSKNCKNARIAYRKLLSEGRNP